MALSQVSRRKETVEGIGESIINNLLGHHKKEPSPSQKEGELKRKEEKWLGLEPPLLHSLGGFIVRGHEVIMAVTGLKTIGVCPK
jgi:hypothetical protein